MQKVLGEGLLFDSHCMSGISLPYGALSPRDGALLPPWSPRLGLVSACSASSKHPGYRRQWNEL